jgi:hypothetical protein
MAKSILLLAKLEEQKRGLSSINISLRAELTTMGAEILIFLQLCTGFPSLGVQASACPFLSIKNRNLKVELQTKILNSKLKCTTGGK